MSAAQRQPGEGPQLFLRLPADCAGQRTEVLCEALAAFCVQAGGAALLLPRELEDTAVEALAEVARRFDVAVLLADEVARCRRLRLDGVQVSGDAPEAIAAARRQLGQEAIIGACCPLRRHEAMELGEAGADYVMIDQRVQARGENLLAWWAQMCTVPVVAGQAAAPAELAALAALGADFVVPAEEMWHSPQQAEALAARWREALQTLARKEAP